MSECKHGMKSGCSYCHAPSPMVVRPTAQKSRPKTTRLSEKMNDRMANLKERLRKVRGE